MTKMKKILGAALMVATVALAATPAHAHTGGDELYPAAGSSVIGVGKRFGLGFETGFPWSNFTAKYYLAPRHAVTASFGLLSGNFDDFDFKHGLDVKGQYLVTPVFLVKSSAMRIPFYVGAGVAYTWDVDQEYMLINDYVVPVGSNVFNIHFPIGIAVQFNRFPMDVYAQFEPGVDFVILPGQEIGDTDALGDGKVTVGAHIWF